MSVRSELLQKYNMTRWEPVGSGTGKSSSGSVRRRLLEEAYGDVNEGYINSFLSDARAFLDNAEREYGGMNYGNAASSYETKNSSYLTLKTKSAKIRGWLDLNKTGLEEETYNSLTKMLDDYDTASSGLIGRFKEASEYYSQWKTEDEYNAAAEKAQAYEKRWSEIIGDYDPEKHQQEGKAGWDDYLATQERIAQNKAQEEEEKPWWEKMLGYLGEGGQDTSMPIHTTETVSQGYRDWEANMQKPDERWTEEQKNTFGYLWKNNRANAGAYAYTINSRLNTQQEQEAMQDIKAWATDNAGAGTAHTVGAILIAPLGIADYLGDVIAQGALGYIPDSDGQVTPFEYSQEVTSGISQKLNEAGGVLNENIPIIGGKGWGDVYGLGTSILQSTAAAYSGGSAQALITFFGSAAASGVDDAVSRGASGEQALLYGTAVGAAEALAEMIGIDNLMKIGSSETVKQLLVNLLKQSGAEGLEEGITNFLGNVADNAIMREKSSFYLRVRAYMGAGLSEEEAKNKAWAELWEEMAYDVLGGFVSGGVHAGPQTAFQTYQTNKQNKATGNTIMSVDGGVDALKALANEVAGVSDANMQNTITRQVGEVSGETATGKGLGKFVAGVKNSSNATKVGKLYNAVQTANNLANASANQADIAKSLERKGFNTETASDIASALVAEYNGQELTKAQKKLLKSARESKIVQDAISNIVTNEQSTMGQRSQNIRSFQSDISRGVAIKAITETIRNNTTAKQFTPTGEYEVSDNGKAIITETGEDIDIKGVSAISKGKLVLELADGTTIDAKSVSFASDGDALIYESIANLGDNINAETANKLISKYDGGNAMVFARGIAQAYSYGFYGFDRSEMKGKNTLSSELTEEQRNYAYGLGEQYRSVKDQVDKAKARAMKAPAKKGVYYRDKDGNATDIRSYLEKDGRVLNEMQTTGIEFMEKMSQMMGVRFNIFESWVENGTRYYLDENGVKTEGSPNGFYDPKTGEIYIDLFAGNDFQGTMLFTVAHELTHFVRRESPEHFTKIAKIVFQHGGMKGNVSELIALKQAKAKAKGKPISYDTAMEEVVADGMETILKDGKVVEFMADVKKTDSKVWAKLKEWFKNFAEFLKKMVDAYSGQSAQTVEGQKVADFSKKLLNQIEQIWAEGAVSAGENYRAAKAQENTTEDGGVKLQGRMTDADIQAVQRIGRISVNQFSTADIKATVRFARQYWKEMGVKSPFFRAWFGDWRVNDQTRVRIANKKGDARGVQQNTDTGWDVQVSGQVFAESKHFAKKNKSAMPYLPYINDIVEKAVLLDSYGIDIGKAKSQNSLLMHSLYAIADIGHGPELLKLYVEEMNDPNSSDTAKRAYQLQNIEKASAVNGGVQGNAPSSLANTTNAIRTVADLFAAVKQKDADFNPNPASDIVDAKGKPKAVYHGSAELFNTFSYGHIGNATGVGILGSGFYFTDQEELARNYGNNLYECFLQMKKPYKAGESDAYKLNAAKLQAQGYDGVILEAPSGTVYMVFNNTQIKSATDNIGTFDGSNADIRYSDRDYSYEALTGKPDMVVTTVGGNVPKNRADVAHIAKQNAAKVGKFNPKDGSVSVYVDDIDTDVILSTKGLRHGLRRTQDPLIEPNYIVTVRAGEILKNAIRINEITPSDNNADGSYVLIGAAQDADGMYVVRFVVNHFDNNVVSMDVLYAVNAKKELAAHNAPRLAAKPLSVTSSVISIAELLDHVNKYFPDILPEGVLRHFGYDARPEGDLGQDALYQDRAEESVSNRSLLANAFEGVAKPEELPKIQEYKDKVALINAEEKKLRELNEQIKELSFAKGPRDTKKLSALRDEATKTANRISIYDKQLFRLEASAPLQKVLEREKKKAYQRAEKKGKEALEVYKEKAAKEQRELAEKLQQSRKKAVEGRHKTAMRHKIKDVVNELNQYLLRGTKDRHVPIELQKAVAEALDAVNMDTVGAEDRIAKLKDELLNAKTPEQIQDISRKIDHIQEMGDKMNGRLQKLKDAYDQFVNSDDPLIANSHDEVISNKLQSVIDSIGNTPLRDMTLNQLEDVYDMYRMVLTTIRNANKAFKAKKSESISILGNRVMMEVERVGGKKKYHLKGTDGLKSFDWNNLKPVYAFERIGSGTLAEIFSNVRAGEDTWATDVGEARGYYLEKSKKYAYDSWDFDKQYKFKSTSGMEFELSLEQIMSLYAFSKREQAADHLKKGGIVFDETTEVTMKSKLGIPLKFNPTEATAYNLSDETLADIISKLSAEQKGFVDEMQDYLSTVMGAKGNEVSLAMYGIKLFKEKFYFPLKSATQFLAKAKEQQQGETKIKNKGFSKETVQNASNPIVLTPFMDVWADHVNEMSMYHAFVLPMEDFYRVYNYKTPTSETMATESVEMFIQNAYGKAATKYIDQLLKDLNGGAMADPRETFAKAMMSKFKKAKVMASLSVIIQQPSAIGRAFALVAPKYFQPTKDGMNHNQLWEELKQYAPVAVIKEMGYFDTNMGMSTKDFIKAKEYSGFKEKAKAIFTDSNYRDELLSKAPALADELAWCAIWNAVKRETVSTHKNLRPGSEEFLKVAGERFTEVVSKTQVYDSVLARSANMRSKSGMMSMLTSFMAEPTTTINMLEDAILKVKRGNKGYAVKAFASVATSIVLNNALVAIVYAMRDDDEDETFLEKYVQSITSGMLDDINPLTFYPFLKDVWSLLQGYDIERSDMSLISDLTDAAKSLVKAYTSEDGDVAGAWWDLTGTVANIGGIPMQNIRREVNGAINFFSTIMQDVNGRATTWGSMGDTLEATVKGSLPVIGWLPDESKTDKLYDAIVSGDTAYVDRLKSGYKDESAYNSAVRKALRKNDSRIKEAAQAVVAGRANERAKIAKEIEAEGNFSLHVIQAAINAEIDKIRKEAKGD